MNAVFGSLLYILIPSCWLSWDRVFLILRAVSRAAPLAYQHSLIIFAITRKACRAERRQKSTWLNYNIIPDKCVCSETSTISTYSCSLQFFIIITPPKDLSGSNVTHSYTSRCLRL